MTEPTEAAQITVPVNADGSFEIPEAPEGYSSEMEITVHVRVTDADGNIIQDTLADQQKENPS